MPEQQTSNETELNTLVQKMIDAGESEEQIFKTMETWDDLHDPKLVQQFHQIKGLAKGLIQSPWEAAKFVAELGAGTIADVSDLLSGADINFKERFFSGLTSLATIPEELAGATNEQQGEMVGNFIGQALLAKYAPKGPKPMIRGAGTVVEQIGKKAEWPLRMVGAHKLGMGNPLGIIAIGGPELLQATGRRMQQVGRIGGFKLAPSVLRESLGPLPKAGEKKAELGKLADLDAAIKEEQTFAARRRPRLQSEEKQLGKAEERADLSQMRSEADAPAAPLSDEELIAQFRAQGAAKAPQTLPPGAGGVRLAQPRLTPVPSHAPTRGSAYTSVEGFVPSTTRAPKVERVQRAPLVVTPEVDAIMKQRFKAGMPEAKLRGLLGAQGLSGQALEDALLQLMLSK